MAKASGDMWFNIPREWYMFDLPFSGAFINHLVLQRKLP
jgi:hypothetical protein